MNLAQLEQSLTTLMSEDPDTFFLVVSNLKHTKVASPWFKRLRDSHVRTDFWDQRNLVAEVFWTPRGIRWRLMASSPEAGGRALTGDADSVEDGMAQVDTLLEDMGFVLPGDTPFENRHRTISRDRMPPVHKPPAETRTGSGSSFAEAFANLKVE